MKSMAVYDRYQVGDADCGLVSAYSKKSHALRAAYAHGKFCDGVTVYDVMAHYGAPQEWDSNGGIVSRRVQR